MRPTWARGSSGRASRPAATNDEALKAVESHKAEVVAAVAALVKDRDERTRELLAATEHGRAQHLLVQTLTTRREAVEKEVRAIEDQQAAASQDLGKLRADIKQAEADLSERQSQIDTAQQRLKNVQELAVTAETQFKNTQAEDKKLAAQVAAAKSELDELTASVVAKSKDLAASVRPPWKRIRSSSSRWPRRSADWRRSSPRSPAPMPPRSRAWPRRSPIIKTFRTTSPRSKRRPPPPRNAGPN